MHLSHNKGLQFQCTVLSGLPYFLVFNVIYIPLLLVKCNNLKQLQLEEIEKEKYSCTTYIPLNKIGGVC